MSNAALASIVSLDEYRRSRGGCSATEKRPTQSPGPGSMQTAPVTQTAPAVWVYWVPVWVW
jgi:hypothetical protein